MTEALTPNALTSNEPTATPTRSCSTCRHIAIWNNPGDRETPPDAGWDCNHPNFGIYGAIDWEAENACETDEAARQLYAAHCPGYEQQPTPIADPWEEEDPLTDEQRAELTRIAAEAEHARLIRSGHMTEAGEPTDAYFQAASAAYDALRGA